MLKSLLNVFGRGGRERTPPVFTRQVDLSGNVFRFAMREDFSRDMPAEDMVEQLDLKESEALKRDGYVTLLRRWWDVKEPGLFGKYQGSVSMTVTVWKKPANQAGVLKSSEYDFHQLLDFVVAIYDGLHQRFKEHNEDAAARGDHDFAVFVPFLATSVGESTDPGYEEMSINGRRWISTGTEQRRQSNEIYALPLDEEHYLEAEFALMPSDNVSPYEYLDIGRPRIRAIVNTFVMHYSSDNPFDTVTSQDWMNKTSLGEMEAKNILTRRYKGIKLLGDDLE